MQYRTKPRWTAKQVNFLMEKWDNMRDEDIAIVLGRSLKSVRKKREYLELKKRNGRGIVEARSKDAQYPKNKEKFDGINKN